MKTRKMFASALSMIALAIVLAVVVVMWYARHVEAIQDSEDFPSDFGFVEFGAGQTARLNVVSPPPEPDTGGPQRSRRVVLAFDVYVEDEENRANCGGIVPAPSCLTRYRFLRRESREIEVMPGHAASFDFVASSPTKINASVHFLGGPDTIPGDNRFTPEPHLASTLEVREGTRTVFVVPAVARGFNPQPDPPGQQK